MYLCAKTKCSSCSVHSNVTTTNNSNLLAMCDRSIIILTECFHKVVTCQVLVSGEYTVSLLTRDSHEHWKSGTGSDKYSLKSLIFKKLVDCYGFTNDNVGLNLNTQRFYVLNLCCNYFVFWKTEFRNTINKNSTSFVKCLEDCYIVTHLCKISGAGKSGRTGTDHCNFMSVLLCSRNWFDTILLRPVSNETLQFTNGNSFPFQTADTFTLALCLLRTYTSANSRKSTGLTDDLVSFFKVSFFYFMNEAWDIDRYRASFHTFCFLTAKASVCFFHCLFFIVTKANLFKVSSTNLRSLLSDWYFL